MPISYTNRKGVAYMLYRGQTRTGKPRYYLEARAGGKVNRSQNSHPASRSARVSTGWSPWSKITPH